MTTSTTNLPFGEYLRQHAIYHSPLTDLSIKQVSEVEEIQVEAEPPSARVPKCALYDPQLEDRLLGILDQEIDKRNMKDVSPAEYNEHYRFKPIIDRNGISASWRSNTCKAQVCPYHLIAKSILPSEHEPTYH